MIYAQLPTNSSSLKRALKKKRKTRICRINDQSGFVLMASLLTANERTNEEKNLFEDDRYTLACKLD